MANPLFERNLLNYEKLPSLIKDMHDVQSIVTAIGISDVVLGKSKAAVFLARIFGFPDEGVNLSITVTFEKKGNDELLFRDYGSRKFQTIFKDHPQPGYVYELFGPLWFEVQCECSEDGIKMIIKKCRLWNVIPLPFFLLPKTNAMEKVNDDKYHFDVDISMPLIGRIIWYKGHLEKIISSQAA
ncbi:MAG: DUF4166 domain-containing protein [Emcibacteraceae bacterium]